MRVLQPVLIYCLHNLVKTQVPKWNLLIKTQVSDSSQIHGMILKYSDDEVTDEEIRELNLQTAACQYMVESDAQHQTTPISFQKPPSPPRAVSPGERYIPDGQNTRLSQIVY